MREESVAESGGGSTHAQVLGEESVRGPGGVIHNAGGFLQLGVRSNPGHSCFLRHDLIIRICLRSGRLALDEMSEYTCRWRVGDAMVVLLSTLCSGSRLSYRPNTTHG